MPGDAARDPSELVETASAIGGALAGTAVTLVAGPFAGSASGEAVARVLLRIGSEIERRVLAPRQERRIAAAYQAASEDSGERLDAGEETRTDGFFDRDGPDGESPADELLEGVLRTAADEWEQRKVPYIGRIFSGLAFDPSVSPAEGSYLIKLAERLTYRQMMLLALWDAAQVDKPYHTELLELAARISEGESPPSPSLLAELNDLASAGLLGVVNTNGDVVRVGATVGSIGALGTWSGALDMSTVVPTDLGRALHRLMDLDRAPKADLDSVLSELRGNTPR